MLFRATGAALAERHGRVFSLLSCLQTLKASGRRGDPPGVRGLLPSALGMGPGFPPLLLCR